MTAALAVVLSAAVLTFTLVPIATRRGYARAAEHDTYDSLIQQRDMLYEAIKELESDHEMGKLSDEDYAVLSGRYRRQAVAAMKAVNERELAVEEAVQELRRSGGAVVYSTTAVESVCSSCGSAAPVGATICARCATARQPRPARAGRNAAAWTAGAAAVVIVFVAFTAGLYLRSSGAQAAASPIANIPMSVNAVALAPDVKTVLAGTDSGVLRSTDVGSTWRSGSGLTGDVTSVAVASDGAYYGVASGRLYRSADGGASWTAVGGSPPDGSLQAVTVSASGVLYAADRSGALYTSGDAGRGWALTAPARGALVPSLAVGSLQPTVLFAAQTGTGVLLSSGGKWGSANGAVNGALPTTNVTTLAFDLNSGEGGTLPTGERVQGTLYAGTDQGVFKSSDFGASWFGLSLRQPIRAITVSPDGSGLLIAVSDSGAVFRSTDRGVTWSGK